MWFPSTRPCAASSSRCRSSRIVPSRKATCCSRWTRRPIEIAVKNTEAQLAQLQVQLVTAEANSRNLGEQLKSATGQKEALASKLDLARMRLQQYKELADSGAGTKFDYEQAQADVQNLEGQFASIVASRSAGPGETGCQNARGRAGRSRQREGPDRQRRGATGQCQMGIEPDDLSTPPPTAP